MITITFNSVNYNIPQTGNRGWGTAVTNYLSAISTGALQKSGGNFTLTADANFGANYGLLSKYFSTRTALPSTGGLVRLAISDSIGWRNNANSGNLLLTVNASDQLVFNGTSIISNDITALTGDVTATGPGSVPATIAAIQGTTVSGATGTGNVVFSASPTLTGTITAAAITASGTVTAPLFSGPLTGNVTGNVTGNITGNLTGNVTGNVSGTSATFTGNLTGDVTSVGMVTTLTNAPVIAKVLTGYTSGAGTVAATDSILQAIQKINGNVTALVSGVSSVFTRTGAVVATTGDYSVGQVTGASPLASPTFTGTVTVPTPFTIGAVSMTATGTQLNYLNAATGTTGTTNTNLVFSTSPTLITPNLGTPSTLVGTNITGTAAGLTAGNVTTNANLTGDVTSSGNATTIAANAVTNAKAAQMAAHTFKGNNSGSTANALDLTATQLTAELNNLVGDSGSGGTKGLVPAPSSGDAAASKFLKADGTWTVPAGTGVGTVTTVSVVSANGFAGTVSNPTANPAITLSTSITGILQGDGTAVSAKGTSGSGNIALVTNPVFTTPNIGTATGSASLNLLLSGGTLSGALNLGSNLINSVTDPVSAQDAATKNYVDTTVNALSLKAESLYATTSALPSIVYANGSSGVGATLTGVALGALSIDGNSPAVTNRVLVKNQASAFQNGIYTVTATGSGAAVFVLTRATDFNQASELATGAGTYIVNGTVNADTTWALSTTGAITMGTTALTFAQVSGPGSYTAGTGIGITGTVISLANPSSSTIGGIQSLAAVTSKWINTISTSGVPSATQPAFSDISGSVAASQLPNPSSSTLGGIQSLASVVSKWINTISTSGVPSATQPAFSDISGNIAASQFGTQAAGTFFKGPNSGSAANPSFAALQAPTIQKFTSGSGTYNTPAGVLYIHIRMVGGGSGGSGSATAAGNNGGIGGNGGITTFGTSLLTANGGTQGANAYTPAAGGTASLGTGPIGTAITGGAGTGGGGYVVSGSGAYAGGGSGTSTPFGGGGGGGGVTSAGFAAPTNTGAGGGGAGSPATGIGGAGGAAGGYIDAIISAPSATYAYAIGAAGTAGTAGASGSAGGAGGSGYIVVVEYYQ